MRAPEIAIDLACLAEDFANLQPLELGLELIDLLGLVLVAFRLDTGPLPRHLGCDRLDDDAILGPLREFGEIRVSEEPDALEGNVIAKSAPGPAGPTRDLAQRLVRCDPAVGGYVIEHRGREGGQLERIDAASVAFGLLP